MTTMHVIAYYRSDQDPGEVRAALLASKTQPDRVAMRAGWLYERTESGFTHVWAPDFPGIMRAYDAILVHPFACDLPLLAPPQEIIKPPRRVEVSVLSAGANLRIQLDKMPPRGLTIAINEAASAYDADWLLSNDGFGRIRARNHPVHACRKRHATTVPGGPWFDLERIGINDGIYSTICGLRLAAAMRPRVVWLYGNDLIPGKGIDGLCQHWDERRLDGLRKETEAEIAAMTQAGIKVRWVRWVHNAITINGLHLAECNEE